MMLWLVQHAKARFSVLLDACQRQGANVVCLRGTAAVARPSLKDLLLFPEARTDTLVLPRGGAPLASGR